MGNDQLFHKKKALKAEDHRRKKANRAEHERILIVCEGEKTEPNYFRGLRDTLRLNRQNVVIADKKSGLDPMSLVKYALEECKSDKDFEHVYCVFDRDKHATYNAALDKISHKDKFHAITSIPCFEVWILLHFTYTTRPFETACSDSNCDEVIAELGKFCSDYRKGTKDIFMPDKLETAILNSKKLEEFHKASGTDNPSTKVHILVEKLKTLNLHKQQG